MWIYYFVSDVIRTIDSVKEPVMKEVESHENLNITQLRKKEKKYVYALLILLLRSPDSPSNLLRKLYMWYHIILCSFLCKKNVLHNLLFVVRPVMWLIHLSMSVLRLQRKAFNYIIIFHFCEYIIQHAVKN